MPSVEALSYITNGGAVGVLSWVFYQVLSGNLVPRKTHEKSLEDAQRQAQIWEAVAQTYKRSLELKDGVVPAQLESAQTVERVVQALQQAGAREAAGAEDKK